MSIAYSRGADGSYITTLSEADLNYLVAREYQRQRELLEIAHNEHGIAAAAAAKPFRNGKSKLKPKTRN